MNNYLRLVISAAIAAVCASAAASESQIVPEQEAENNALLASQFLNNNAANVMVQPATLGVNSVTSRFRDFDFYSFYAKAGDTITIDIDKAWKNTYTLFRFNGNLMVWGPDPEDSMSTKYAMVAENDQADSIDEGSENINDPRIDNFTPARTGVYVVGVTSVNRPFNPADGTLYGTEPPKTYGYGPYELIISGASPAVKQINIIVKPGMPTDKWAPINPKSRGKVPVALLSGADFDALAVNVATLTFGHTGEEASLAFCHKEGTDVNKDGRLDLLCHFNNEDAGFNSDSRMGVLKGQMQDGMSIEGRGVLKVVPAKL